MRKLTFLLTLLLLLICLCLPLSAAEEGSATLQVYDNADFFTDEQEARLEQIPCTHDVAYFVVTSGSKMSDYQVANRCGIGSEPPAIVLVIDRTDDTYYYEMFVFNRADKMFFESESEAILDDPTLYNAIKRAGDLELGCTRFFELCTNEVNEWHFSRPLWILLIAAIVALLAGGFTVLGVFLHYRKKRHGESYPLGQYTNLQLTESRDVFTGSHITRVRVQSNSGGGGRSGGGGFSGGSRGRR